jgi:hypothetical protein
MMKLKENPIVKTFGTGTTLMQLLDAILPEGIEYKVIDKITVGDWRINRATPAKILEELKSNLKG